jgi:hypothetical protein
VLTGSKPAALSAILDPSYYQSTILWKGFYRGTLFKKGLEVWKKYQHLFPSNHFCFLYNNDEDGIKVFLINKKQFIEEMTRNIEDFKAAFGMHITAEGLIDMANIQQQYFLQILDNHVALKGIILGYGKHNSHLFQQRDVLRNAALPKKQELIEKKMRNLDEKLGLVESAISPLQFASMPAFACDLMHPETQDLLKKYALGKRTASSLYQNGSFLETTLKLIKDSS